MKEHELLAILRNQISNSIGASSTESESDQADALDYYYGEPFGNEVEGRSSVVTREVLETTEWVLGQLLKVFTGGNRVMQFDPVGAEDEQQAKQETDYINHVFMKENNGFMILHDWFKDALLQRNAYCKVWVEDAEETSHETYQGLDEAELAHLLKQEGVEPVEHSQSIAVYQDQMGNPIQAIEHDIKIKVTRNLKRIKVAVVPPEEIGVAKACDSLSVANTPFMYHRVRKTVSALIAEGYDKELISSLPSYSVINDGELESARDPFSDHDDYRTESDDSMREIEVYECYIKLDYENNGVATLRKICMAGNKILDNEEMDFIPFAVLSSNPMPHKHLGLSEADKVMDIQRIKSTLMRGMLDNLYLTNNPEKEVLDGAVNISDLLDSMPGGIKRVKQMGSIREITVPFTAGASIPMLEILDSMRESRTGVSRATSGLDPNVIAKSTSAAFLTSVDQSNQHQEKIARIFAETGVRELFHLIHRLAITHIDKSTRIKINNNYIDVTPTEWRDRTNLTISVGLGTGDKTQAIGRLMALAEKQEQHLQIGMPTVTPQNLYNTYNKIIEVSDMGDTSLYFTSPDQIPPQEPPPDPNMVMLQMQGEIEQAKLQVEHAKMQQDAAIKMRELEIKDRELAIKERELLLREMESAHKTDCEVKKLEYARFDSELKASTALSVEQLKAEKDNANLIKLEEARLAAEAKLQEAQIKAQAEIEKAKIAAAKTNEKPQEVHIHNGGTKKISVKRTPDGLEGISENIGD